MTKKSVFQCRKVTVVIVVSEKKEKIEQKGRKKKLKVKMFIESSNFSK